MTLWDTLVMQTNNYINATFIITLQPTLTDANFISIASLRLCYSR